MGMAASQARFLGLTARKSNVEFEGQQINQQRTTLSNQSANYYSDLLGMSVPTPPSVDSYTKTVYTFNDGALTNTITSLIAQDDGMYTLSYLSQYEDDFAPVAAATSIVNKQGTNYFVGSVQLRQLGQNLTYGSDFVKKDPSLSTLSEAQLDQLKEEEEAYIALLNEKYGTNTWMVRYTQNASTGAWSPYFYKLSDLNGNGVVTDANGNMKIKEEMMYTKQTAILRKAKANKK